MASHEQQPRRVRTSSQFAAITIGMVALALSAPFRLVAKRLRGRTGRTSGGEGGPPAAGDRFPRRPKPTLPSDAIALSEPRPR